MQDITVTIQGAHTETSIRREYRHADGERGGMVSLEVSCERGQWRMWWGINRGRGWKTWNRKGMTEAQARDFANEKWALLTDALRKLEPVASGGAAAVFSAQVATMH